MKSSHFPPLIVTLDYNETNYECEQKPRPNCLYINDNSELKAVNEIKIEADLSLDEIQTENTIFATELNILENINNKKNIKDDERLVSEKKENRTKNNQRPKKRKKKTVHQPAKKHKLSEGNEGEIEEPCTSKVLKQKIIISEQMSDKQVKRKSVQEIIDETIDTLSEDFDNRSDSDNTDSDYEFNVPSKCIYGLWTNRVPKILILPDKLWPD